MIAALKRLAILLGALLALGVVLFVTLGVSPLLIAWNWYEERKTEKRCSPQWNTRL